MPDLNWQLAQVMNVRPGRVRLRFGKPDFCQRCQRGEGCGAGVFAALFARRSTEIEVDLDSAPEPGEWVRVGVAHRTLAIGALLTYGLPLLAFVAGTLPGHWLVEGPVVSDLAALAGGLISGAVAFVFIRNRGTVDVCPVVQALSCEAQDTRFHRSSP